VGPRVPIGYREGTGHQRQRQRNPATARQAPHRTGASDHHRPQAREPRGHTREDDRQQGSRQVFEGVKGGHRGSSRAPLRVPRCGQAVLARAEATPNQSMRPPALLIAAVLILGHQTTALAQSCKSFRTCEEAMQSYKAGNNKLDGDKDGIPCEALCGKNLRK